MLNICIVGATGLVGREMLKELEAMQLNNVNITLFASAKSKGSIVEGSLIDGKQTNYVVEELSKDIDFSKFQIALFSAGSGTSLEYAPLFAEQGCYVVDNSSAFRRDENIPLLAMGVNFEDLKNYDSKIIANPNCSTIQSVIALNNLSKKFKIRDIDYVTYQSVSGSGVAGIKDLENTLKGEAPQSYAHPIANNVIPQIDKMLEDNYTYEEEKMILETQKILNSRGISTNNNMTISATCCRVPVRNSHMVEMRVEFENSVSLDEVLSELSKQEHLEVLENELPMPLMMKDKRNVVVGRVRKHRGKDNVILMMCAADNLKVGAATNACEIARYLVNNIL